MNKECPALQFNHNSGKWECWATCCVKKGKFGADGPCDEKAEYCVKDNDLVHLPGGNDMDGFEWNDTIQKLQKNSRRPEGSSETPCSTLDEYALIDKLAVMLGISGPMSQEERNMDIRYRRNVLRKAVLELKRAWDVKA